MVVNVKLMNIHNGPALNAKLMNLHKPCGSGLARESGVSACIDVDCAGAIASKLGSHMF